jgi:hypothetical protein
VREWGGCVDGAKNENEKLTFSPFYFGQFECHHQF